MMANFSVETTRRQLESGLGYSFLLGSSFEEAKSASGLASSGSGFINAAIKCYLVGLDREGGELAGMAESWLKEAIDLDERPRRYFPDGTEAGRLYDLTLARWLLGRQDDESLRRSIEMRERYFARAGVDPVEVGFAMVEYLDGGRCDLIENHADRLSGIKRKTPELATAIEICGGPQDAAAISLAVTSLVRSKASEWLNNGHFDRFAKWVKVGSRASSNTDHRPALLRSWLEQMGNGE